MAPTDRSRMTSAEFPAWHETRPPGERHELVDGEIVTMAAERVRHVLVHHRRVGDGGAEYRIETSIHADGALALDPPGLGLDVAACFASIAARG